MPRKPWFQLHGVPQHIVRRGNNRVSMRKRIAIDIWIVSTMPWKGCSLTPVCLAGIVSEYHGWFATKPDIQALNQGLVLGQEEFKNKVERMTQRQTRRGKMNGQGWRTSRVSTIQQVPVY